MAKGDRSQTLADTLHIRMQKRWHHLYELCYRTNLSWDGIQGCFPEVRMKLGCSFLEKGWQSGFVVAVNAILRLSASERGAADRTVRWSSKT